VPVLDEFRHRGVIRRENRQLLRSRLENDVGKAVAIPALALPARQHEDIGRPERGHDLILGESAREGDALRDAERRRLPREIVPQGTGADDDGTPAQARGQLRGRLEKRVEPFLRHQAADREKHDGIVGIGAVTPGT
jgi:hypothetical protein